jgi:hypothetical protein
MKTRPVGAGLFHADGRTVGHTKRHMTKLIVSFRNFSKVFIKKSFYRVKNHLYGLVFPTEANCVLCDVRTESLHTMQVNFNLQMLLISFTALNTKYVFFFKHNPFISLNIHCGSFFFF